jgi:hypothetical protein
MQYSIKQKAFHILPTVTFITAPKKARFKSHIGAKSNVCLPYYFSNKHFKIIVVLQYIFINVTNLHLQAEGGYTAAISDGSDQLSEHSKLLLRAAASVSGTLLEIVFLVIKYSISLWFHINSAALVEPNTIIHLYIFTFIII